MLGVKVEKSWLNILIELCIIFDTINKKKRGNQMLFTPECLLDLLVTVSAHLYAFWTYICLEMAKFYHQYSSIFLILSV